MSIVINDHRDQNVHEYEWDDLQAGKAYEAIDDGTIFIKSDEDSYMQLICGEGRTTHLGTIFGPNDFASTHQGKFVEIEIDINIKGRA